MQVEKVQKLQLLQVGKVQILTLLQVEKVQKLQLLQVGKVQIQQLLQVKKAAHKLYLSDFVLLLVVVNDRLRDVVEGLQPLFDGLFIVVHSPAGCRAP